MELEMIIMKEIPKIITHKLYINMEIFILESQDALYISPQLQYIYKGQYQNGSRNGIFIVYYPSGNKFKGNFVNGIKNGNGRIEFYNGDIYEGEFQNGLYQGQGKYYNKSLNCLYEGEFFKGQMTQGQVTFENGIIYKGQFKNGQMIGKGQWIFNDRIEYGEYIEIPDEQDIQIKEIQQQYQNNQQQQNIEEENEIEESNKEENIEEEILQIKQQNRYVQQDVIYQKQINTYWQRIKIQ